MNWSKMTHLASYIQGRTWSKYAAAKDKTLDQHMETNMTEWIGKGSK